MVTDLEKSTWGPVWPYVTLFNVLLVINAVLGLAAFEWAWRKTRRFRKPIEELDAQFPELARRDAPDWKKWKLYPGAVSLLVPRLFWTIFMGLILVILLNVILICHDSSRPITGIRRFLLRSVMYVCTNLISVVGWFTYLGYDTMTMEQVNHYEEYLGTVKEQERA
jgi:hypothetical protein